MRQRLSPSIVVYPDAPDRDARLDAMHHVRMVRTTDILDPHNGYRFNADRFALRLERVYPLGDPRICVLDVEHDSVTPDLAFEVAKVFRALRPGHLGAMDGKPNPNWGSGGRSDADREYDAAISVMGAMSFPLYANGREERSYDEIQERTIAQIERAKDAPTVAHKIAFLWHLRMDGPSNEKRLLDVQMFRLQARLLLRAGIDVVCFRGWDDGYDAEYWTYVEVVRDELSKAIQAAQASRRN